LLSQKDSALVKSRELLAQSHKDAYVRRAEHVEELKEMTDQLARLDAAEVRARHRPSSPERPIDDLARVDAMAMEIKQLGGELAQTRQELRGYKERSGHRQRELLEERDRARGELEDLQQDSNEHELRARELAVEKATLVEQLASAVVVQDHLKAQLQGQEQTTGLHSERHDKMKDDNTRYIGLLKKRDETIRKLKYDLDQAGLSSGVAFGVKAARNKTVMETLTTRAEDMGDRVERLQELLQANSDKAKAVVKKLKGKLKDSDDARDKLTKELKRSLERVNKLDQVSARVRP